LQYMRSMPSPTDWMNRRNRKLLLLFETCDCTVGRILNPWLPDLNGSCSGCLPEFFLGFLYFNACSYKDGSRVAWISLASVGYDSSRAAECLLLPHLVFQPNWGWGHLGFFQLLQSNSSPEEA